MFGGAGANADGAEWPDRHEAGGDTNVLIIAASALGGAGRSVTSGNLCYQWALQGNDVCYLDFNFGSATAGATFGVGSADRGGLHSFLQATVPEPQRVDVWAETDNNDLHSRPPGAGRLVLLPGDRGGGDLPVTAERIQRCARLLPRLEEEFGVCVIDLSAGRSFAVELVLAATAMSRIRPSGVRWLVFLPWTRQDILASADLVWGDHGLVATGGRAGHDRDQLADAIRFVRTRVADPDAIGGSGPSGLGAWVHEQNSRLQALAARVRLGRALVLGTVPDEPVLRWQAKLISAKDVHERRIASPASLEAYTELARLALLDSMGEVP